MCSPKSRLSEYKATTIACRVSTLTTPGFRRPSSSKWREKRFCVVEFAGQATKNQLPSTQPIASKPHDQTDAERSLEMVSRDAAMTMGPTTTLSVAIKAAQPSKALHKKEAANRTDREKGSVHPTE